MNKQQENDQKRCEIGQIWQLGDHRLYCGSSDDLPKQLFDGMKVKMICTDPPYGVDYVESKENFIKTANTNISRAKSIINDQIQTDEEYTEFTRKWLDAVKQYLDHYNTAYIFNSDLMYCALKNGMREAEFYYSQMIIWIKNTVVVGRKDYLPQNELIAYGWYGRHKMERGKDKSIVSYPKPSSNKLHPTMKPVGLIRRLILNSTKVGDVVYDAFGGSGTTLIACEHTKRRCIIVEIDPEYCDQTIKRWEILTGKRATLLESGS